MAEDERRTRIIQKLKRELGDAIMSALDDPKTVEICLNTDGTVWVEKLGHPMMKVSDMPREKAEAMLATLASALDAVITAENPILEGELPIYGARFEAVVAPIVSFPAFAIRKKASMIFTLEDYVAQGVMTEDQLAILEAAVADRSNILVTGGTGSGKTTLTNALIHAMTRLTPEHRVVVMEDTAEIQCVAENKVFLRTSTNVTMRQLLRVCMRMRPDRILVGEVRGGEALDLLKAWGTGHPGGICTIHANNAVAGLTRLEGLIAEVSQSPMQSLIADAVNIVVGIVKRQGKRFVEGIYKVEGYDVTSKRYITKEVISYDERSEERYITRPPGARITPFPASDLETIPPMVSVRQEIQAARAAH